MRCILALFLFLLASTSEAQQPEAERLRQIVANLQLEIPQLRGVALSIADFGPAPIQGLDQGNLVLPDGQSAPFMVSRDNRHLLLLALPPLDASRSTHELASLYAAEKAEEARARADRSAALRELLPTLPARGPADAPVSIVVFSDFQCPYCARALGPLDAVVARHAENVRLYFAHFPLDFHSWALPAAVATTCAAFQGSEAFWTVHDQVFARQRAITDDNLLATLREIVAGSGIDADAWEVCASNQTSPTHTEALDRVNRQFGIGRSLGITGTPALVIDGEILSGAQPEEVLESAITNALLRTRGL